MAAFRCVLAGASLLALMASGCAKAKAETVVADGPPLAVPAPPPRLVAAAEPLTTETPEQVPLPASPATPPAAAATPPPVPTPATPAAAAPARPATRKPEAEVITPPETARSRELRPAPSPAAADEERRVNELIARAAKDLARRGLSKLEPRGQGSVRPVEAVRGPSRVGREGPESPLRAKHSPTRPPRLRPACSAIEASRFRDELASRAKPADIADIAGALKRPRKILWFRLDNAQNWAHHDRRARGWVRPEHSQHPG